MSFISWQYLVLFLVVLFLFFNLPGLLRNPLLLGASVVFYMAWRPEYILLVLFSVSVDYVAARVIADSGRAGVRRLFLVISLVANLGVLFFFKYYAFAAESLRQVLGLLDVGFAPPALDLILPLGISFYVFQAISYVVDVYRGTTPAARSFSRLLLYVLFFPQLVAGPIERSDRLLPQFAEAHAFDADRATQGLRLILWGFVKKVAVADRLALLVDPVYSVPWGASPGESLIATYAFAFQIYADFSGYSDIAIGSAHVLGFRLVQNFRQPYFAADVAEFWRRWHISLSTWFRDYVYIPLGGGRGGPLGTSAPLVATFLLSGLWHGARWTFVLWGLYHGLLVLLSRSLPQMPRVWTWVRILVTFHLVLAGWVLFRAESLTDALLVASNALSLDSWGWSGRLSVADALLGLGGVAVLLVGDAVSASNRAGQSAWPTSLRWALYVSGVLLVLNGAPEVEVPFIYFQF